MQILKGNLNIKFTFVSGMFFLKFGHDLNWSTLKSTKKFPEWNYYCDWYFYISVGFKTEIIFTFADTENGIILIHDLVGGYWRKKGLCSITNCKTLVYAFVCNM